MASSLLPGLGGGPVPKPCSSDEARPVLVERLRSIMLLGLLGPPRSSLLAELAARTRSDARSVRPPPGPSAAAATSRDETGESGGRSERLGPPPPEPRLALALGEEEVPCRESLLCAWPLDDTKTDTLC
jgi:hypothetical protein